jgi:hypothetical protein
VFAGLLAAGCAPPAPVEPATVDRDPATLYAPHRADGRFFNPWAPFPVRFGAVVRWWLSPSDYDKSGDPDVPIVANDGVGLAGVETSPVSRGWDTPPSPCTTRATCS